MNKIKEYFLGRSLGLVVLGGVLIFVFSIGIGFSLLVLVSTSLEEKLFSKDFCFTGECVSYYFESIDESLIVAKATLDVGVAIATIGGIFVALLSYINSSGSAALANHIEHLKVFREYIDAEIERKDRLSKQLIDSLLLYGFIFDQSRSGKTSVSAEFRGLIVGLNSVIQDSNNVCKIGATGGFDYKKHQQRIRDQLSPAGIQVYLAPRNDYFEMERQLFLLIQRISQSFCAPGSLPDLLAREYY
ncbi:retron Ec48 family effector membrane protein [Comamonas sp. CMM03]|uniref:retron Ec48 family effector membrane protein n=1 Tax=Comamonas sp. CMM03 TaxID=2854781 RepID=UPI001C48D6C7|nr:retron Ec48 family effector membrane protein [Comamonas sp. CMM03]MBV7417327.1 retron Ec48 family effector membrane protein [Comamonas sp. CMM03]